MALNTLIASTTIILSIFVVTIFAREQNKPGKLHKLCGNDFVTAYQDCCDYGYPMCASMAQGEGKVEALERRGNPLMPSRVAKNFLGALRKRGYEDANDQSHTGAVEECCNEGCDYQEIAEYPCFD